MGDPLRKYIDIVIDKCHQYALEYEHLAPEGMMEPSYRARLYSLPVLVSVPLPVFVREYVVVSGPLGPVRVLVPARITLSGPVRSTCSADEHRTSLHHLPQASLSLFVPPV